MEASVGRGEEVRAAGGVIGDALAGVVGAVRDVHQAIAGRTFAAVGPVARPVRVLHDGIAGAVYATVRGAHAILPRVASAVAALGYGLAAETHSHDTPEYAAVPEQFRSRTRG